ncbi:hypothetical protein IGB42_04182 [Andreprevotia sp. IGB-42]|nr:hypothetical protein IGB42_04182 [Andreprevotia sp. IGB-42]
MRRFTNRCKISTNPLIIKYLNLHISASEFMNGRTVQTAAGLWVHTVQAPCVDVQPRAIAWSKARTPDRPHATF